MTATEHVILVDENDNPIGTAEKLEAHQKNLCHRAFSVFVFRNNAKSIEVLLQQRALGKYHSGGLWTNTCCSHPRVGEEMTAAGQRRLFEEMGFSVSLESVGSFHYIAELDNDLIENEIDYVLVGWISDEVVKPDPSEVKNYRWIGLEKLHKEIASRPETFTPWLKEALSFAEGSLKDSLSC